MYIRLDESTSVNLTLSFFVHAVQLIKLIDLLDQVVINCTSGELGLCIGLSFDKDVKLCGILI